MDANYANKLLDVLIENASRVLAAGFGVNWAEAQFFEVVRLLRIEASVKSAFLDKVARTFTARSPESLATGMVPVELIELVAHELRWPEILDLAQGRIDKFFGGDPSLAVGDVAQYLSAAYDNNWRDREFYERYSQAHSTER